MIKYQSLFKIKFISGLQYRAAAWAGILTQFTWGFLEILMFKAFYEVNPTAFPHGLYESRFLCLAPASITSVVYYLVLGK